MSGYKLGTDIISKVTKPITLPFLKSNVISNLKRKRVKDVDYDGNWIKVHFDNLVLKSRLIRLPNEQRVGSFSKVGDEVYYDDDLVRPEYIISIGVHETLEKYFKQRYGLDENNEGHILAEHIEKQWFIKNFGKDEWKDYMRLVSKIHKRESKLVGGKISLSDNIKKKFGKLSPKTEIAVGTVVMVLPPFPDPSDAVGAGMVVHGYKRLKKKGKKGL